jgi:uncharacterized protein YecT (DUF1311 family)
MKKTIISFLFCLSLASLVHADCTDKQSDADIKSCLQQEYEKSDKELNVTYSQLMAKLDPEGKEMLKKAQKAWIQYRDADAEFSAHRNKGGTFAGIASLGTLGDLTARRVKDLKDQLELYK